MAQVCGRSNNVRLAAAAKNPRQRMVAVTTARRAAPAEAAHTAHEREGRGHAVRSSSRGYPRLDLYTAFAVCSIRVEQFNVLLRTPS